MAVTCCLLTPGILAADYRVESLDQPAPKEGISEAIRSQLAPKGIQVIRGKSRTVCEIWVCEQWPVKSFKPAGDVSYPFRQGQLIGVIRYTRKGSDIRDQTIDKGTYTLRYLRQPVDGDHTGVSPMRDFLVLARVEDDAKPDDISYQKLVDASAEAVGTSHPATLAMTAPSVKSSAAPSIQHDQEHDWWVLRLKSSAKAGDQAKDLSVELVVAGTIEE